MHEKVRTSPFKYVSHICKTRGIPAGSGAQKKIVSHCEGKKEKLRSHTGGSNVSSGGRQNSQGIVARKRWEWKDEERER